MVTVSFVIPTSLAVFFDVSTDEGVEPLEAPVVPGAAEPAAVVAAAAVEAEAAVVPDELPELLLQAAATSPTVQSMVTDLSRFNVIYPPCVDLLTADRSYPGPDDW